jgi:hypothetical protein
VGRSRRCLGFFVACFVGWCGFGCVAMNAARTRELVASFGSLSTPQGVAIDQSTGDVYVADTGNARVEKFDAIGNLLLAFGANVGGSGVDTCTSLLTCVPGTPGSGPGAFTTPEFVAIDPTSGDVYVGDTGDNAVSKFTSAGTLVSSWGTSGQLNGSTTTAGSFGELGGIAVSAAGHLLVYGAATHVVFEFAATGGFLGELELKLEAGSVPRGLAVDGSGDLFKANGDASIERFGSTGEDTGTIAGPGAGAFTVEPVTGDVYVAGSSALEHFNFNGTGEVVEPGGGTCPPVPFSGGCAPTDSVAVGFAGSGIAVSSSSGDSYVSNPGAGEVFEYGPLVTIPDVTTGRATGVTGTSAVLNGSVNPDEVQVSECVFEYGTNSAYGQSVACEAPDAAEIPVDGNEHAVHAAIAGLTPGVVYHFRLRARNVNGANLGGDETVEALPPPAITGEAVSDLTVTSAQLQALVNPRGSQVKACTFEYGSSSTYGASVGCDQSLAQIGAGTEPVAVSSQLRGLSANQTYHWRLAVENVSGVTTSPDHTFIYDTTGGGLSDGRAYEMVTPPQKNGSLINDVTFVGMVPDIAADGSRVMAATIQCFAESEACNGHHGDAVGSPYEFTRTPGGWVTTPLAPPASVFSSNAPWGYDATTDGALFSMATPPFGENDFYLRNPETGSFQDIGPNTPPEDGSLRPQGGRIGAVQQAQTGDYSHFAWQSPVRWPFDEGSGEQLYEYSGLGNTRPLLVGVTGGEGSHELISNCVTKLGPANNNPVPGKMSGDGETVFFTAEACPSGLGVNMGVEEPADGLYARIDGEQAGAHTVALSRSRGAGEECTAGEGMAERACRERTSPSECGTGAVADEVACREAISKPAGVEFAGASEDGSKAFFLSPQQLTDSASEDPTDNAVEPGCFASVAANGCNLYEYDLDSPAGHQLVDVSAGAVSGGPRVQGVLAVSPDGSHVYFVAKEVLTEAANERGQVAQEGADNLYLFERDASYPDGRVVFITDLAVADSREWTVAPGLPTNVTPEGRYLVFLSSGQLTADDTSESGAKQVFRYDAVTGQLIRISIGNEGFDDNGNRSTPSPCGVNTCSESALIVQEAVSSTRSDPTMSDDGRFVFFQSPLALTPGALDDVKVTIGGEGLPVYAQNVYEWHEGHVFLISDGRDVSANNGADPACPFFSVCLLGSDASGANVFFTTADGLVGQDTDGELDIYDARVCTAESPCLTQSGVVPGECEAAACQGSPGAPPAAISPSGSATFSGPGNLAPVVVKRGLVKPKVVTRGEKLALALRSCRRKHPRSARLRVSCERAARRAYAAGRKKAGGHSSVRVHLSAGGYSGVGGHSSAGRFSGGGGHPGAGADIRTTQKGVAR